MFYIQEKNTENLCISFIYIGEHNEEIGIHMCDWLMQNIKTKILPNKFKRRWNYFYWETESLVTKTVPGLTIANGNDLYWKDELDFDDPDKFPLFYKRAYLEKASEFIIFNNNCYISIVAIRGRPSPKEIGIFVLGRHHALPWSEEDNKEYLPYYII